MVLVALQRRRSQSALVAQVLKESRRDAWEWPRQAALSTHETRHYKAQKLLNCRAWCAAQ
jgi:hypothetical protein